MVVEVKGLKRIQSKFNQFQFRGKNIKYRFLEMVGVEALDLLKMNTPVDTGALREAWVLQQSENEITIINDQHHLLAFITFGTIRHIANPFIEKINNQVNNMVMARLELALSEQIEFFRKLPGGKNRKFQQVGRTSAGFKGGISFAGRSSLVRAGTGRRQLKRRLSLRRRRGRSVNPARKDVKVG
jgi:hypothetical protein